MQQDNEKTSNQGIDKVPPIPSKPPKKKSKKIWLWILLLIFVVFPILSVIVGPSEDKTSSEEAEASDGDRVEKVESDSIKSHKDLKKAKQLAPKFTTEEDEFKGVKWISPKSKPQYRDKTGIYSYFALRDSVPENMRLVIQYGANDWLFVESYTFLIDGKTYEFSNPHIERDNNTRIWEWSDTGVLQDGDLAVIYALLLGAKEAKIRFNGRQYHDDYTIPQSTLQSLQETKDYYLALGGK